MALDAAARLFDQETRRFVVEGTEAYSATAAVTRYFDDITNTDTIEIHDLLTSTTPIVIRGSTTILAANYKLLPLNRGNGPATSIQFGRGQYPTYDQEDHYYFSEHNNLILPGALAITGIWGYCSSANRPAAIKNAVLDWAAIMYKTGQVNMSEVLQMITVSGPTGLMAANVVSTVKTFKRGPYGGFV
jgi:hypothetical protein